MPKPTKPFVYFGRDSQGNIIAVGLTDSGDDTPNGEPIYNLKVDSAVSIDPGNITIAAVKVQDEVGATEAVVNTGSVIVGSDHALAVRDANPIPAGTNVIGAVLPPPVSLGVAGATFTSADQSAAPAAVTDAPTAGQKLVITDLIVSAVAAMTVTFTQETNGVVKFKVYVPINGTVVISLAGKLKLTVADKRLMVQTSIIGAISVTALFFSEA